MPQQQSPFLEGKYGWNFGESGWNTGMDENLLKFSFMFDKNVDSIVSSLPAAVNGQAHYLTTDNRLYFAVGNTYFSTPVPKWFEIVIRSTGQTYQFNGTTLVQTDTPAQVDSRLDSVELTVTSLGTAAFEDVAFFATQSELDVATAVAAAYTDALRDDLANDTDVSKGAELVSWVPNIPSAVSRLVSDKLTDQLSFKDFGILGDGSDETVKLQAAFAASAGKVLRAEAGKTYFTTDELLVPSDAVIDFCGSNLNYTIAVNGKNCIRFLGTQRSTLRNVIITPVGVTLGDHGGSRMPVCIGEYGNTFGNTPNRDILIENVSVIGGFDAMNAFAIFGDTARVRIINPRVIGQAVGASAGIGILVHWSANNTGAPTTSYHPNSIEIVNPYFEKCALGTAQEQPSCIFLSGTHNVSVTNMVGDDINTGVYVYPGDFGYTYARASDGTAVRNITLSGITIKAIRKFGIYVLGQANGAGPSLPMGVTVAGGHLSAGNIGVRVRRCADGVTIADTYVIGANTGVTIAEATDVKLGRLRVVGNTGLGVYLSASSRCVLRDSLIRGNNTSALENQLGSAVYLDGVCADNAIEGNHIGGDVATEYYGVRVNGATVVNTKVSDNIFYNFTTNVAIQNDAAPYTAKTNGEGNVFAGASLLTTPVTPPIISYDSIGRATVRASAAPTVGTWKVGDRFVNSAPAVGQPKAWVCTVAGTPGTWVSEGNL